MKTLQSVNYTRRGIVCRLGGDGSAIGLLPVPPIDGRSARTLALRVSKPYGISHRQWWRSVRKQCHTLALQRPSFDGHVATLCVSLTQARCLAESSLAWLDDATIANERGAYPLRSVLSESAYLKLS